MGGQQSLVINTLVLTNELCVGSLAATGGIVSLGLIHRQKFIGELFEQGPPGQFGFRGDPGLWHDLEVRLKSTPVPPTEAELIQVLERAFKDIVGVNLPNNP